ncbi:MAG: ComEC/Rec2 family competence protein [Acutalibacteraceae bacterium]|jgi:competence protein ComEC
MAYTTGTKRRKLIAIVTAMLCIAVFVFCLINSDVNISISANSGLSKEDYVKILDVGQGDSILIYSNGFSALIDTGPEDSANELCAALQEGGIKSIDVLFLTHLHYDHTGGVSRLFEKFTVKNLILPELSTNSEGIYSAQLAINEVTRSGGGVYSAVQGMNLNLGDFEITVIGDYDKMEDENNRSLIIMAKIQNRKFLFAGDAEIKTENALIADNLDIRCDVLKVAHHGSLTSTSEPFIKEAAPKYAAISVGKGNFYGHPHKEVINTLKKHKVKIYRTDKNGDITFYIKKGNITVMTER